MKFNNIVIPEKITKERGIEDINLNKLSNVIALVGKNGSGKSRILTLIEKNIFKNIDIFKFNNGYINNPPELLLEFNKIHNISKEEVLLIEKAEIIANKLSEEHDEQLYNEFTRITDIFNKKQLSFDVFQNRIKKLSEIFQQQVESCQNVYLRKINFNEINFLQNIIQPNDSTLTFENLVENIASVNDHNYDEFKTIHKNALEYLSQLPHQLVDDLDDCYGDLKKFEKRNSYKRFESLKTHFENFLNKELSWEKTVAERKISSEGVKRLSKGIWKVNNREFKYEEFSDGEKTLFAFALLFFLLEQNPKLNIKESILLIDEPELHLHPDSEIDLIEGLRKTIGEKGQLIFATHSINILSSLNFEEIFMVKDNKIKRPSTSTPGETLSELMGIEARVSKLSNFLTSIDSWTFANFMTQCFDDPEVIESSKPNDPQVEALKKAIIEARSNDVNILLDFGAGKGRLYEQLKEDSNFFKYGKLLRIRTV